jgi:hypothetical protein
MYILRRIFWRFVIVGIVWLIYQIFGSFGHTQSTPMQPAPITETLWAATAAAQPSPIPAPTEGIRVLHEEPEEETSLGETIILKTDVYYRAEPTGDEAYWVVRGSIAREVADILLSEWNDSFSTDEGYVVNVVTREVSKKLDFPYKCSLVEGDMVVSVYAYGEYLSDAACK